MYPNAVILLTLLVGPAWNGLASPPQVQIAGAPEQRLDALTEVMRAVTNQGLFAEEYDAILDVAQGDAQLREKIIEQIIASLK
jgi:hypothetical protein